MEQKVFCRLRSLLIHGRQLGEGSWGGGGSLPLKEMRIELEIIGENLPDIEHKIREMTVIKPAK